LYLTLCYIAQLSYITDTESAWYNVWGFLPQLVLKKTNHSTTVY
jgi:hypothetical protein